MNVEEISEVIATDPEAASRQLAELVGSLTAEKAAADLAAQNAREAEGAIKTKYKENLDEFHPYKNLGTIEELTGWRAKAELKEEEGKKDDAAEDKRLQLELRTKEIEADALARKVATEKADFETAQIADRASIVELQRTLEFREKDELIRLHAKGRHNEDGFDDLARRLRPNLFKEADGTWVVVKPGTEELIKDAGGIYLTPETLLNEALEGAGSDSWNSHMSHLWKPIEGGSGTRRTGGAKRQKKLEDMSMEDRINFIKEGGTPDQFGAIVNAATQRKIAKMTADRAAQ